MAMSGYSPETVTNSINKVKSAYKAFMDAMNVGIQNRFVVRMEEVWGCEQAQRFFREGYKPTMDSFYNEAEASLASVVNSMNDAARQWAAQTESQFSPVNHESVPNAANVDGVRADIGGVKGIDLTEATAIVRQLNDIKTEADNALEEARMAVADCGFVGGEQQASINQSLSKIKNSTSEVIGEITSAVQTQIDSTVDSYGTLEKTVSSNFTAQ